MCTSWPFRPWHDESAAAHVLGEIKTLRHLLSTLDHPAAQANETNFVKSSVYIVNYIFCQHAAAFLINLPVAVVPVAVVAVAVVAVVAVVVVGFLLLLFATNQIMYFNCRYKLFKIWGKGMTSPAICLPFFVAIHWWPPPAANSDVNCSTISLGQSPFTVNLVALQQYPSEPQTSHFPPRPEHLYQQSVPGLVTAHPIFWPKTLTS